MPAAALRQPELDNESVASAPASAPDTAPQTQDGLDWHSVAPLLKTYDGVQQLEQAGHHRRRRSRRHKPFGISTAMVAGAVIFCELFGLLWLKGLDTKAMRQVGALDSEIATTNEEIARTQKKISALNSSPLLSRWAREEGFRPTQLTDFDDVTKNTPLVTTPEPSAPGGTP